MPSIAELEQEFGIRDHLSFHEDQPGMPQMRIATDASEATIYLQGAHLTRWNPRGQQPVLYLSPRTELTPGKAIRGGVPVLFPWFGDRWNAAEFQARTGIKAPSHGFARTSLWTVERTHLSPEGDVHVTLSLGPSDVSRALGYDSFAVRLTFRIGRDLHMALAVTNTGAEPMQFEEGLHTYFEVGDVYAARVRGLRGSTYIDKRDNSIRKVQRESLLAFTRDVDQVHVNTAEPLILSDPAWNRDVHIEKAGSHTTVTWNPWDVLTPGLKDMPEDGWKHFVCVEAVNAGEDRITLPPGQSHVMACSIRTESHAEGHANAAAKDTE